MNKPQNVSILGIGRYLPNNKRENSWWPKEIIEKWIHDKRRFSSAFDIDSIDLEDLSPEAKILIEALTNLRKNTDIFEGSTLRYIMSSDEKND